MSKTFNIVLALGLATTVAMPLASAMAADEPHGGTVKGAAIGAVAGHEMGGHTKSGAVVGAMVGHHEKAKSRATTNTNGKS